MFLSVLIPNYNYICYPLVATLQKQLLTAGIEYEIIVADDGSTDTATTQANQAINALPNCYYRLNPTNIGRAAIRNILIDQSKGDWLLFLDSDAEIISDQYIGRYIDAIRQYEDYDIIAGGLRHPDRCPSPQVTLRYKYEKQADLKRDSKTREERPFEQFAVFNTLSRRQVFDLCRFDEHFRQYGYEDTVLGYEMERKGLRIKHINNQVLHIGLEDNATFLRKTETAIQTLRTLNRSMQERSKLIQTALWLQKRHLLGLFKVSFRLLAPALRWQLLSHNPSLRLFALYKLGTYVSISKAIEK